MTSKKGFARRIIFGLLGSVILFVLIVIINLIITGKYQSTVTKGEPIEDYGNPKSALLVIDIQEATTGSLSAYPFFRENSDELIKNINRIVDSCSDHNILIINIRSEISNPLMNLLNNSYAKGSDGAQFDKRLKATSGFEVIKNAKDSFKNTNLDSILTANKVNKLYIVGLDAAECINATVEASQNRNYSVNLIDEAILSKSIALKDSMIVAFKARGVSVLHIDSIKVPE